MVVGCDVINFEINLLITVSNQINFSNQAVFSTWPKNQGKNSNILKELLR